MKKISIILVGINLVLVLAFFNFSVFQKEETLKSGELVLLELAPVDPRSLFQGDYMRLDYAITRNLPWDSLPKKGYFIIKPDENRVAQRQRIQEQDKPLNFGEIALPYKSFNYWTISIGAESYFFQEGQAEKFDSARYGGLRLDKAGNSVLTGLYDKNFKPIK